MPVMSLLVHITFGVSNVMQVETLVSNSGTVAMIDSDTVKSAMLIPDTVSPRFQAGSFNRPVSKDDVKHIRRDRKRWMTIW